MADLVAMQRVPSQVSPLGNDPDEKHKIKMGQMLARTSEGVNALG